MPLPEAGVTPVQFICQLYLLSRPEEKNIDSFHLDQPRNNAVTLIFVLCGLEHGDFPPPPRPRLGRQLVPLRYNITLTVGPHHGRQPATATTKSVAQPQYYVMSISLPTAPGKSIMPIPMLWIPTPHLIHTSYQDFPSHEPRFFRNSIFFLSPNHSPKAISQYARRHDVTSTPPNRRRCQVKA
ncbi:hypothetical protein V2G26_017598 [Clonostachys chloroleuca]